MAFEKLEVWSHQMHDRSKHFEDRRQEIGRSLAKTVVSESDFDGLEYFPASCLMEPIICDIEMSSLEYFTWSIQTIKGKDHKLTGFI